MEYVIYESALKPSMNKGELPDIIYRYVSNTSLIGFHFDLTNDIKNAYRFDEDEKNEVKQYSHLLGMKYKTIG